MISGSIVFSFSALTLVALWTPCTEDDICLLLLFPIVAFIMFFSFFVYFYPNDLGHPDNYIPGNPMVTPEHIVPEWYFLPSYAILRSIPNKLLGVLALLASILILLILPVVNSSAFRSTLYRPIHQTFF